MKLNKINQLFWIKKLALLPLFLFTVLLLSNDLKAKASREIEPISFLVKIEMAEIKGLSVLTENVAPISKLIANHIVVADTIRTKVDASTTVSKNTLPSVPNNTSQIENTHAEYPGGLKLLRTLVMRNFRHNELSFEQGTMRTNVVINIDKQGKVTRAFAFGTNKKFNDEAYRAFQKANGNKMWKPATENGIPVEAEMILPLSIQTE